MRKRPTRRRLRRSGLGFTCPPRDARAVTTQKTQLRERLGAQIKRARRKAGMKKQDHLAEAIGMSVSVVSLAERGAKVEDKTLALIEQALGFPPGTFADFLAGRITSLPESSHQAQKGPSPNALERVLTMTREEMFAEAEAYDEIEPGAGDRWIQWVLSVRDRHWRQAGRTATESSHDA